MAVSSESQGAKTAHVNMMTDTIITNVPAEGLRAILRSLLASHPEITATLEAETRHYIQDVALPAAQAQKTSQPDIAWLKKTQTTIRCMLGCGLSSESLSLMNELVGQGVKLLLDSEKGRQETYDVLAAIDGDVVQIMTAVEKTLSAAARTDLLDDERELVNSLHQSLTDCRATTEENSLEYPYGRALFATSMLLGVSLPVSNGVSNGNPSANSPMEPKETFEMNARKLPRLFTGLWQMSSPSWGSAPESKIFAQFSKHAEAGMTAFDMADHYGDAEIIFVSEPTRVIDFLC